MSSLGYLSVNIFKDILSDFQGQYVEKMRNLNAEFPYDLESKAINVKYLTKCYLGIIQCTMYNNTHGAVVRQAEKVTSVFILSYFVTYLSSFLSSSIRPISCVRSRGAKLIGERSEQFLYGIQGPTEVWQAEPPEGAPSTRVEVLA